VADVQRAGGVGGNEFDLQAAADAFALRRATSVIATGGQHGCHHGAARGGRQREIDEAGTGDLDLGHERRSRQFAHQRSAIWRGLVFSSRASCIARLLAKSPWLACFGTFEKDVGKALGRRHAGQCRAQQAGKVLAGVEGVCGRCAACSHV
jgi:hypothetical protein